MKERDQSFDRALGGAVEDQEARQLLVSDHPLTSDARGLGLSLALAKRRELKWGCSQANLIAVMTSQGEGDVTLAAPAPILRLYGNWQVAEGQPKSFALSGCDRDILMAGFVFPNSPAAMGCAWNVEVIERGRTVSTYKLHQFENEPGDLVAYTFSPIAAATRQRHVDASGKEFCAIAP